VPNLANIAKNNCFPKNVLTFLAIFFMPKICHLLKYQLKVLKNQSIWDFYQMNTGTSERKHNTT